MGRSEKQASPEEPQDDAGRRPLLLLPLGAQAPLRGGRRLRRPGMVFGRWGRRWGRGREGGGGDEEGGGLEGDERG